ncbi:MAG: DUF167 domain-containing protein [Treponema sp.]|jgi:uncharacterized protein (TIGR00251 family)|nr:DUF167 domain-containing protein [Treponema sp.]
MKTAVKGVPAPREKPPGAWLRIGQGRLLLDVKALPGASKTALAGVREGRLRVRLAAPPEDGRANAALIAFLAKILTCPKNKIVIYLGEKTRLKTIAVSAESPETLAETLKKALGNAP